MNAETKEENLTELERSDIHTATSIDEEEREHLNSLNKSIYIQNTDEPFYTQKSSKIEEIILLENKINPFSLSSSNKKSEKMIEKSRDMIKYTYFILSCLCTTLDGFILIFIGYNTSILSRENKWEGNRIILIDVIYHLISAIGGVLSIFTSGKSNMQGLFIGLCITLVAFCASFYLIAIKNFFSYLLIFFIICLSNGHLQNICTTQVIKKFTNSYRAAVYVFVYFFTQLGKFFFALILLMKNELISKGNIIDTVYPIIIIISLQIVVSLFMICIKRRKKNMKESFWRNQSRRDTIFNTINKNSSNYQINSGEASGTNPKKKFPSISKLFYENFNTLLETNWRDHTSNLVFLNLSLGIQFFSMINVFPLINGKNTQVLVEEIFWSKTLHTIFLLFIPTVYLFKLNSRKFLLFMTFTLSLFLNVLIFLDFFNSSLVIHLFRFIWNVCYITVNLYCAEAATKRIRTVNTALMYLIFKLSCIIEIITIDKLIAVSLYVPILLNIVILIGDMMLVSNLKVETHMKSIDEIEAELNDFGSTIKFPNYNFNYKDNLKSSSSSRVIFNEN